MGRVYARGNLWTELDSNDTQPYSGSLSHVRGQCEAMVVYRYCKIITNCEINNATEKQFEVDKLLIIC